MPMDRIFEMKQMQPQKPLLIAPNKILTHLSFLQIPKFYLWAQHSARRSAQLRLHLQRTLREPVAHILHAAQRLAGVCYMNPTRFYH